MKGRSEVEPWKGGRGGRGRKVGLTFGFVFHYLVLT